ncbi:phytanoyl-CoA dioxygenase family protein [Marinicella sp. W31]|uniref:phytanoyl-CoA dioxygenase family protein n=1 Tax=Marinicella sp. W31 TaxID=3023713 RepID=UPI0037573DE9
MLSTEQIHTFKRDGVLILKQFFSPEEIDRWKHQVLNYFKQPQTPADWRTTLLNTHTTSFYLDKDPTPVNHPKMQQLYACFNPHIKWQGENELVARGPEIDAEWLGARAPHLDYPVYAPLRTLANSLFYLKDVSDYGAPMMYWPGSHHIAWDYYTQHPQDYMTQGELSQDQVFKRITDRMTGPPVPFSAEAGDLLIWHALMLHSPSVNKSHSPRLAIIGRWGNQLHKGEERFDFNGDQWQHWQLNAGKCHSKQSKNPPKCATA